jgi:hypothetical protein
MRKESHMRTGLIGFVSAIVAGVAVVSLFPVDVAGQSAGARTATTKSGSVLRTSWGDPDLQGLWTNTTTTPFERLPETPDKAVLTDEERVEVNRKVVERLDQDRPRPGVVPYNDFWYERGTLSNRTSLIIDPPEGKLPPLTPEGKKRLDDLAASRKARPADSWLDRSPSDRCITRAMPGAMMPGFYNHNYQILQTPGYVTILVEMMHDARIIPLDGRPHLNPQIRQWLGDSRGRWEGSTLVVETTNFTDKAFENGGVTRAFGANQRMVERFTRVGPNAIDYQFTIEEPGTFTRPWTVSAPMTKMETPLYEYACHEGNYSMTGILSGTRADEKAAAAKQPK